MLHVDLEKLKMLINSEVEQWGSLSSAAQHMKEDKGGLWRILNKGQEPNLATLNKLAGYFAVPTASLLTGERFVVLEGLPEETAQHIEKLALG